jgi:quercetin dioxygenase-like cupin family protein
MKVLNLDAALKKIRRINNEISYSSIFEEQRFTSGIIVFRASKILDRKQIQHPDKDVVCHVLKGRGRLRVRRRQIPLAPGTICHIPKGTPHDFAANRPADLVMFYSLIQTARKPLVKRAARA